MQYRIIVNNILLCVILALTPFVVNRLYIHNSETINFLNVGQGDSTLICTANNSCGLIDTGKNQIIIEKIQKYTKKPLSFILITHPDYDHFGQTQRIIEKVGSEILFIGNTLKAKDIINFAYKSNIPTYELRENNDFYLGNIKFDILWPDNKVDLNLIESNDSSTALIIKHENKHILFAGDLSSEYEDLIQTKFNITNLDVLKISHHGSKSSSSLNYLSKVNPKLAIIPVGKNSYGHPSSQVLDYLGKLDIKFLRTDLEGDISISLKKENLEINTEITKNSYIILN